MTIVAFCYSDQRSASVRYRVIYPLEQLHQQKGIQSIQVFPGYSFRRICIMLKACWFLAFQANQKDVVLIHKVYSKRLYARILHWIISQTPAHLIYDIDDAEWERNSPQMMHRLMSKVHTIHVGSHTLKEMLEAKYKSVLLLTSCVNAPKLKRKEFAQTLHLGWIGGYNSSPIPAAFSHKNAILQLVLPALQMIKIPMQLTLLGVERSADRSELDEHIQRFLPHVQLFLPEGIDWNDEAAIDAHIEQWDLGIAIMVDHPFNHAKSAFKAKQYMNCGTPALGNRVGENVVFIQHRSTGFIASSSADIAAEISYYNNLTPDEKKQMRSTCLLHAKNFRMNTYTNALESSISALHLQPAAPHVAIDS